MCLFIWILGVCGDRCANLYADFVMAFARIQCDSSWVTHYYSRGLVVPVVLLLGMSRDNIYAPNRPDTKDYPRYPRPI